MPSLQSELVRNGLANPDKHRFDLGIQAAPAELQHVLRRLKSLEHKFGLMDPSQRILHAVQYASAMTVEEKVETLGLLCEYLETL